ncbi:MAG TPA: 4-alpha-glucanotransferase, partial [Myxococcota bacterium]|nr:4-alpha-glucanotransferase [Myxococcota bacterium]
MTPRPRRALRRLADRLGILASYVPAGGGAPRRTSDATREVLVAAMGFDASSEAAAARALRAREEEARAERAAARGLRARLVAPDRAFTVREALGGRRGFGIFANLYAVRSARNLGFGDFADLRALVRFAARHGAAFVGLNPLHALRLDPRETSPYSPATRFFREPLYLELEAIPELAHCGSARRILASAAWRSEVAGLREAERIDYAHAAILRRPVLEALHATFVARHGVGRTPRGRAFEAFLAREGETLLAFASFRTMEEAHAGRARDWRAWPVRLRDPGSDAVREFRRARPREVGFHAWLQFELDAQLAAVAREARAAGMAIGLYPDLALGSSRAGFDAWAFPRRFASGVTLGAPPDDYAPEGQDWNLPALLPARLAEDGFAWFARLLGASFAHAGALRVDHVLGFQRQWWIPAGRPASEGAYVRFPARELLGVLAHESRRARALVIGEDLGTVPPGLTARLARRGILSSRVLLFERDTRGGFKPARRMSPRALLTANTHDLPSLAAFWSGRDLGLRRELGVIPDDASLAQALERREAERKALLWRLNAEGAGLGASPSAGQLCAAVYAFLCRSPAPLVGVSLDDLAGETEPVNVPGVGPERFPSWTRRLGRALEALARDPGVAGALAGL